MCVFLLIFVADKEMTFSYNFAVPLSKYKVNTSLSVFLSTRFFHVELLSFMILANPDNRNHGLFLQHFKVDF